MQDGRPKKQDENSKREIEGAIESSRGRIAPGHEQREHEHDHEHWRAREHEQRKHDRELPQDDGNLNCPACDRSGLIAIGYRELQCSTCGRVITEEGGR